jgi:hypothetical protein
MNKNVFFNTEDKASYLDIRVSWDRQGQGILKGEVSLYC